MLTSPPDKDVFDDEFKFADFPEGKQDPLHAIVAILSGQLPVPTGELVERPLLAYDKQVLDNEMKASNDKLCVQPQATGMGAALYCWVRTVIVHWGKNRRCMRGRRHAARRSEPVTKVTKSRKMPRFFF